MFIANQRAESSQPLPPHSAASPKHLFCNNYRCRRNKHTKKINENFDASKNTNMKFVFLLMLVPIRGEHKHWFFVLLQLVFSLKHFFGFSRLTGGSKISYLCQVAAPAAIGGMKFVSSFFCIFYLIWTRTE